jgi:Asp-tRNA(Asn)/Glu-tRNA(Gln) amidotransferase A subunit family amidase
MADREPNDPTPGLIPWTSGARPGRPSEGAWLVRDEAVEDGGIGVCIGLGVCVKDVIDVAGFATEAGSNGWWRLPIEDAPAVAALRAAGARILGKGHTVEFAYGIHGLNPHLPPCRNPWDPARLCGGSSSGPAAAVAAGEADIGLGTDTSGSLRVPAAFCGLYALRPTHGLVSTEGIVPLSPSLDVCGPLTRDPATLARAMTALAGWPSVPSPATEPPARVGVVDAGGAERLVAARLGKLGSDILAVELPDFARARAAHRVIQTVEAAAVHDTVLADAAPYLSDEVRGRLQSGREISADELAAARAEAEDYRAAVFAVLDGVDVVLVPVTAFGAPLRDATEVNGLPLREALMRYAGPLGMLGAPVLTVPAATRGWLPLGVQVLGRPGDDRELVSLAALL